MTFNCPICKEKSFEKFEDYDNHLITHDIDVWLYMKAKCYVCGEKIDLHNRCRKRACRAQLEKKVKHD